MLRRLVQIKADWSLGSLKEQHSWESWGILTFVCILKRDVSVLPRVSGGADDNLIEGGEMKFVCKPGARNITMIFQPLLRYMES